MIRVRLYEHPLSGGAPSEFIVDSLPDWLLGRYGESPEVSVQVFLGEPSLETEITNDINRILSGDFDDVVILQSPAGFDPFSWTAMLVYALVIAVAYVALAPKPVMPGNINRTQQSPNNALANRENQVRILERVEDIYGTVKSIPSLMMPTYSKYISHRKYEHGYYCIGRGYYNITEVRDGDTLVADIPGAGAKIYGPFTSPNGGAPTSTIGSAPTDFIITASRAIEVDGITLKAENQVILPASASYTFTPGVSGGTLTQASKQPNFNSIAILGTLVVVSMTTSVTAVGGTVDYDGYTTPPTLTFASPRTLTDAYSAESFASMSIGETIMISGAGNAANNGSFVVDTKASNNSITVVSAAFVAETVGVALSVSRNYSGTYSIQNIGDGYLVLEPNAGSGYIGTSGWLGAITVTCSVTLPSVAVYSSWVTLPDTDRTEVWCNIIAPNGMYKDNNGKSNAEVTYIVEIEKLNASLLPLGIVETVTSSLSGAVADERAETVEHSTAWTGPARVRMKRTTLYDYAFAGQVQDEIKWADLYSVSPVMRSNFGNKTTIQTVTQATARATAVKSRQLNCVASRLLPTYSAGVFSGALDSTGLLVSGTLNPTSKMSDVLAAVSIDPRIGARNLSTEVDMVQIAGVQAVLDAWNINCGQINYTFDSDTISFEETISLICNAAFCIAYRQNGKIRVTADLAQTSSSAIFTHRNKKPKSETITRRFSSDSDYDGVEFVYVDQISDQSETIKLPLDGSASKYKKFEIAGIQNFTQAWFRANREFYKLRGQRISIETVTTLDARSLLPNSRVDIVDNTLFRSYDGEVIGQTGLTLVLSQDVAFTPSVSHSIVLMKRDGSIQAIPVIAGAFPNTVIMGYAPSEAIVTTPGESGIRTVFSFSADMHREALAYLVQEIDTSDSQYVTIKAINYAPSYYAMDTVAAPDRASIIGSV